MISRSGTLRSGAALGPAKILREEGSGPVVTAGRVVSGLERMFMMFLLVTLTIVVRHCERSEAIHGSASGGMDCFVACAPRNDGCGVSQMHHAASADWPSHCLTRASGSAFWVTSETTAMESAP